MGMAHSDPVGHIRAELSELTCLDADNARTMPADFYTSPEFLAIEEEHLLRRQWLCVGHAGEIAMPGDFFTTELLGEQLLVTRDLEGEVRVLSNVCRHRGNLVAQGKGNTTRFMCQYHAWTYRTDGTLLRAPFMEDAKNFALKGCALPRLNCEIWNHFIFVNLDGTASPLAPQLENLSGTIRNYHHELRNLLYTAEDVWNTNWKSLTENFIEGYHLSATHKNTLHPTTPTKLCRKLPGEAQYTAYRSYYDPSVPDRGPYHDDLTEDEKRNSVMGCIFPCFLFGFATHYTLYMTLRPVGVDKVALKWGVAGLLDDLDHPEVRKFVDLCHAFNAEDREKLETQWRGLQTRFYRPGPLAPADFEGTIWDFLQYVAGRLGAHVDLGEGMDSRQ
jgi:phenylpropionate dioxygenase-like ring-hydroxylating dioxygenase large terminal subunit